MRAVRALVTGASGFIGSHVIEVLEEAGVEAIPLLRRSSDTQWLGAAGGRARYGSLDDPASLRQAVRDCHWVLHLAGAVRARSPEEYNAINGDGTARLLEAAAEAAPDLERFVLVSSLAAIGPSEDGEPVDETTVPHPITSYGRSKLLGEMYAREWSDRVPVAVVRPPAVYGPRDRGIFTFFQCARRGFLPRFGRGERIYSMVHGHDLAQAIRHVATHADAPGNTYFVCDPEPYSWQDLVDGFSAVAGRRVRSLSLPPALARGVGRVSEWVAGRRDTAPFLTREKVNDLVVERWTCDPGLIDRDLGFRTNHRIPEGLLSTAEWYRRNGWLP